ncbi:hypothetical protein EVAR_47862_1 [Eumeta japonica]|uniref:Uncharacterized protein n=1 Tax=Eumeta variegata TaxID=151549 RepID=A0A4C1ZVR6_EUMVA|nr:hypothetical protein EVAR_47862_1 [Eumeta japonica]
MVFAILKQPTTPNISSRISRAFNPSDITIEASHKRGRPGSATVTKNMGMWLAYCYTELTCVKCTPPLDQRMQCTKGSERKSSCDVEVTIGNYRGFKSTLNSIRYGNKRTRTGATKNVPLHLITKNPVLGKKTTKDPVGEDMGDKTALRAGQGLLAG